MSRGVGAVRLPAGQRIRERSGGNSEGEQCGEIRRGTVQRADGSRGVSGLGVGDRWKWFGVDGTPVALHLGWMLVGGAGCTGVPGTQGCCGGGRQVDFGRWVLKAMP